MSKKISLLYVADLSEEDNLRMRDDYNYARGVLLKLRKILEEKSAASLKEQRSKISYESPAWSEKQADANGYQRAIEQITTYLLPDPVGEEK